jgi:hypothetical protein
LGALRAAGFTPYGLEVAHAPVDTLTKKGFSVYYSETGESGVGWPAPVLIAAFEVLEHLSDPVGFLTRLCAQHSHAELMLSVPDERRWFLLGGREAHDYPPNHLTPWSEEALGIALDRAGFRHIEVFHPVPTAQELSMASARRFIPAAKTRNGHGGHPQTTLSQEIRKRRWRKRLLMPAAVLLPLFRRTACSMLAVASNHRPL